MSRIRERDELTRRTALKVTGSVVTASMVALAGCSDGGGDDGSDGGDGQENGTDGADGDDNESDGDESDGGEGNDTDGDDNESEGADDGDEGGNTIELGAETSGWVGQAPPDIEGETNPSLSLETGTTYELTWENLDGVEHELIIEDGDEEELEASDSAEEEGETVTLTFEATEEMAAYYCEYHPDAMRSEITVGGE